MSRMPGNALAKRVASAQRSVQLEPGQPADWMRWRSRHVGGRRYAGVGPLDAHLAGRPGPGVTGGSGRHFYRRQPAGHGEVPRPGQYRRAGNNSPTAVAELSRRVANLDDSDLDALHASSATSPHQSPTLAELSIGAGYINASWMRSSWHTPMAVVHQEGDASARE